MVLHHLSPPAPAPGGEGRGHSVQTGAKITPVDGNRAVVEEWWERQSIEGQGGFQGVNRARGWDSAGVSAVWTAVRLLTLRHEQLCAVIVFEAPQRPLGYRRAAWVKGHKVKSLKNAVIFPSRAVCVVLWSNLTSLQETPAEDLMFQ